MLKELWHRMHVSGSFLLTVVLLVACCIARTPLSYTHVTDLCVLKGLRLERVWADLKLWWNKFHTLKGGFVADDCQPNSKFSVLTDETPLAIFLGFKSEDNELVKVLKALMMLQVVRC